MNQISVSKISPKHRAIRHGTATDRVKHKVKIKASEWKQEHPVTYQEVSTPLNRYFGCGSKRRAAGRGTSRLHARGGRRPPQGATDCNNNAHQYIGMGWWLREGERVRCRRPAGPREQYLVSGAGNACTSHSSARLCSPRPTWRLRPSPVTFGPVLPVGSGIETDRDYGLLRLT